MEEVYILPVSAEKVYNVFVDPAVHETVIRANATFDGNKFSYYNEKFTGSFEEKKKDRSIAMKWRYRDWPEDKHSNVTLSFKPIDEQSTKVLLKQTEIPPEVDTEELLNLLESHYWDLLKPKVSRQLDEEIILATKRKRVPHFHGFCSIVIPVSDIERAMKFYKEVFGWTFTRFNEDLCYFDTNSGTTNGALMKKDIPIVESPIALYIEIEDYKKAGKIIDDNGGTVLSNTDIGALGWEVKFKDSEGNILHAFQYRL